MGRSRKITGLVVSIVTLLAMDVAVAQDTTWKECELADRDPDRSIAACSKVLARSSSAHTQELFITADWHLRPRETLTKQSRILVQEFGSIHNVPIAGRSEASSTPGRASTNKPSPTSLKRYG